MTAPQDGRGGLGLVLTLLLIGCIAALALRLGGAETRADDPRAPEDVVVDTDDPSPSPSSTSEPVVIEGEILLEQDEGEPLVPAARGTCRVRAWQSGTPVSEPSSCEDAGRFALVLATNVTGRVAFELEVPGRLRAVLEAEAPTHGRGRLPNVALGLAETVRGMAVNGRGEPLAGIEVQAMPNPNLGEPEPWRAWTDPTGAFTFDTLPPGPLALRAAPEGHATSVLEAIAPQDDVLLVLEALLDLEGRVVGEPDLLAHAHVRIEGSGVWPPREVPVAADGRFVIPGIPDGVYAVEAIVIDANGRDYASLPLENVSPDLFVTLALLPAERLALTTVDPAGRPVAGARITVGNAQVSLLSRVAETDADGHAEVGPLVPGPYVVRADADGYLPAPPRSVRIGDEPLERQTLTLDRPGHVAGRVTDDTGRPIAGAEVIVEGDPLFSVGESHARAQAFHSTLVAAGTLGVTRGPVPEIPKFGDDRAGTESVVSDGDGRFAVIGLAPGEYRLQARHRDHADSEPVRVRVRAERTADAMLVVRSGFPLSGRVVDGNDRPIARAEVELGDGTLRLTDDYGVFEAGFRRGATTIVARAKHHAPRRLDVNVTAPGLDVELRLDDADRRLHGRVADESGHPIEGAQITIAATDGLSPTDVVWTDARGLWSKDGLAPGTFEIEALAPAFLPTLVTRHTDAARPLELVLRRGWSLEVRVRAYGNGDPVAHATVAAEDRRVTTDANGLATLSPLGGALVEVVVEARGHETVRRRVTRPEAGDVTVVDVELEQGGRIEGVVTDYRGDPVADAHVALFDANDAALGETFTDARGRWSFDGVPEGDVLVVATPPPTREDDLADVAQDSDVLRGRTTKDVHLRFDRR